MDLDLESVATHKRSGTSLGSSSREAIMYPYIDATQRKVELSVNDTNRSNPWFS